MVTARTRWSRAQAPALRRVSHWSGAPDQTDVSASFAPRVVAEKGAKVSRGVNAQLATLAASWDAMSDAERLAVILKLAEKSK